jgi:hypothetical protein
LTQQHNARAGRFSGGNQRGLCVVCHFLEKLLHCLFVGDASLFGVGSREAPGDRATRAGYFSRGLLLECILADLRASGKLGFGEASALIFLSKSSRTR